MTVTTQLNEFEPPPNVPFKFPTSVFMGARSCNFNLIHSASPEPLLPVKPQEATIVNIEEEVCNDMEEQLVYDSMCPSTFYPDGNLLSWYTVTDDTDETLVFESRFESGNLRQAVKQRDFEYDLFLSRDSNKTGKNSFTQWFYFSVTNTRKRTYKFNVMNLAKTSSLYSEGIQPCVYSEKLASETGVGWRRMGGNLVYKHRSAVANTRGGRFDEENGSYVLSFTLEFEHDFDTIFVAHAYPYRYTDLQKFLTSIEDDPVRCQDVNRTTLCQTVCGNPVDLLTISTPQMDAEEEEGNNYRPGIVVVGRVHPGETNASWMMHGLIEWLTGSSPDAIEARKSYIWKIVPMLNPDGVIIGNTRCNFAGLDLNRNWQLPNHTRAPTIFHTKQMIRNFQLDTEVELFLDLHGHSRRMNVFAFGNCTSSWSSAPQVYPYMMSQRSDLFSFKDCNFRMQKQKQGSGRMVAYKEFGIAASYTIEASFGGVSIPQSKYDGQHLGIQHLMLAGCHLGQVALEFCCPQGSLAVDEARLTVDLLVKEQAETAVENAKTDDEMAGKSDGDAATTASDDGYRKSRSSKNFGGLPRSIPPTTTLQRKSTGSVSKFPTPIIYCKHQSPMGQRSSSSVTISSTGSSSSGTTVIASNSLAIRGGLGGTRFRAAAVTASAAIAAAAAVAAVTAVTSVASTANQNRLRKYASFDSSKPSAFGARMGTRTGSLNVPSGGSSGPGHFSHRQICSSGSQTARHRARHNTEPTSGSSATAAAAVSITRVTSTRAGDSSDVAIGVGVVSNKTVGNRRRCNSTDEGRKVMSSSSVPPLSIRSKLTKPTQCNGSNTSRKGTTSKKKPPTSRSTPLGTEAVVLLDNRVGVVNSAPADWASTAQETAETVVVNTQKGGVVLLNGEYGKVMELSEKEEKVTADDSETAADAATAIEVDSNLHSSDVSVNPTSVSKPPTASCGLIASTNRTPAKGGASKEDTNQNRPRTMTMDSTTSETVTMTVLPDCPPPSPPVESAPQGLGTGGRGQVTGGMNSQKSNLITGTSSNGPSGGRPRGGADGGVGAAIVGGGGVCYEKYLNVVKHLQALSSSTGSSKCSAKYPTERTTSCYRPTSLPNSSMNNGSSSHRLSVSSGARNPASSSSSVVVVAGGQWVTTPRKYRISSLDTTGVPCQPTTPSNVMYSQHNNKYPQGLCLLRQKAAPQYHPPVIRNYALQ